MSVSGVSSSSSSYDISTLAKKIGSDLVKKLDSNGDGSLDKNEFVSGLTASGVSASDASTQFDSLDTSKSGKLTESSIASAIEADAASRSSSSSSSSTSSSASAASGSSSTASTSSSSSSNKVYDDKDLNKDGTVTTDEELLYDLKHPAKADSEKKHTTLVAQNNHSVGNKVDISV